MRTISFYVGLSCLTASALAQQPDLILFHGKIFTSVAAHPWVEALAILGDRIETSDLAVATSELKSNIGALSAFKN